MPRVRFAPDGDTPVGSRRRRRMPRPLFVATGVLVGIVIAEYLPDLPI